MIITIANQKGGVGKTTTTMNLGVALAKRGSKVLLIDSDPQGNLTSYLGILEARTLDELYMAKRLKSSADVQAFITPTDSGVDLIATDSALAGVEYYLFSRSDKETVLKQALQLISDRYDFILIDTPPSLNLLTLNALAASNSVLVPVQPEFFGMEGIVKIRATIEDVQKRYNPELKILGVLPTQVAMRRKLTQEVLTALKTELGELLFASQIHENAAVAESSGQGRSILDYSRSSQGAQDYRALTEELLQRIEVKST